MIDTILNNQWAQFMALILTIGPGLWFYWDKIRWMAISLKKWLTLFNNLQFNPFIDQGCINKLGHFFGREHLLSTIFKELEKGTNLSLIGERQIGKSSFLFCVYQRGAKQVPNKHFIYLDMLVVHDEGDFFKALCAEFGLKKCRGYNLFRALQAQDKQYVLCLDNIERMTNKLFSSDERQELCGLAGGNDAPLTLLIASGLPLSELFPDSPLEASPLAGICLSIDIPPFSQAEVHSFIKTRLQAVGKQFTTEEIEQIWEATQGHPAQVQKLAAKLYQEKFE